MAMDDGMVVSREHQSCSSGGQDNEVRRTGMLPGCPMAPRRASLDDMLNALDVYPDDHSFGADIDHCNAILLRDEVGTEEKIATFLKWSGRFQPCLFGRLGSKNLKHIGIDMCWIDDAEIRRGDEHVRDKVQAARRHWKDRCAEGIAHGFLVMFSSRRLAYAKPGRALVEACRRVGDLYLPEFAPVEADVIYTEAMPLRVNGDLLLFKGGINLFYPSAHRTLNHDRRIPGGMMISSNSPGHYANSLVARGICKSLDEAVTDVRDIAWRSIGNGGHAEPRGQSSSWHNADPTRPPGQCPMRHRPQYVPENFDTKTYSAHYHTDVLVPTDVTVDDTIDPDRGKAEEWRWLILDYITAEKAPADHVNHALFHGQPIAPEAIYHNPWPPRRAYNRPLAGY
jgi:hypothetical protein